MPDDCPLDHERIVVERASNFCSYCGDHLCNNAVVNDPAPDLSDLWQDTGGEG